MTSFGIDFYVYVYVHVYVNDSQTLYYVPLYTMYNLWDRAYTD